MVTESLAREAYLPVSKDAPLAEFERVAHRFPVFRVAPSHAAVPASSKLQIFLIIFGIVVVLALIPFVGLIVLDA